MNNAKSSSSQRFNDYLNGLQEEFKANVTSMNSASARRFNIYLDHLRGDFELISLEVETLGRDRDKYKAKVRLNICERCRNEITSPPPILVSSQIENTPPSLGDKQSTSRRVDTTQERTARRLARRTTPLPVVTSISSSQSAAQSRLSVASSTLHTGDPEWRITYNTKGEKELNVELAHVFEHKKTVRRVKFSQDGKRLAVGCADLNVYIYVVETGILTCVLGRLLTRDECLNGGVCFSGDGNYLATSARNGNIYIWKIKTKYVRTAFMGHSGVCWSLEFSLNGRRLLSASTDNTVRLWNMRDGSANFLTEHSPTFIDEPCYTCAYFSPDGNFVAASHRDGIVRIWDVATGRLMRRVVSHGSGSAGVKFMPDGMGLVSGGMDWSGDTTLKYWDISSLNNIQSYARWQTTNKLDGHVSGVDEQTQPERIFSGHENAITSLAVSRDGLWIASGSWDNSVRIWNPQNAAIECILDNVHKKMYSIDFSPAGFHLASGGEDGSVKIWKYTYTTREKPISLSVFAPSTVLPGSTRRISTYI